MNITFDLLAFLIDPDGFLASAEAIASARLASARSAIEARRKAEAAFFADALVAARRNNRPRVTLTIAPVGADGVRYGRLTATDPLGNVYIDPTTFNLGIDDGTPATDPFIGCMAEAKVLAETVGTDTRALRIRFENPADGFVDA